MIPATMGCYRSPTDDQKVNACLRKVLKQFFVLSLCQYGL